MKLTVFIFLTALLLCNTSQIKAQIHIKDSLALVDLYNSCGGANWTHHDNWLTKAPVSTWYGIFYIFNNHVTGIDLQGNNLKGTIPASIGNMPALTSFFIVTDNKIQEPLPASLKNLTQAYDFEIDNNALDFDGIEILTPIYDNMNHYYRYSPQATIPLTYNANKLSVSAGGTLANDTFHWYKNGKLVATKVGIDKFQPKAAGKYYVTVTNKIATALTLYSDTITITSLNDKAKIDDARSSLLFSIYPNPAKDILHISFSNTASKILVSIYDNAGKVIEGYSQTIAGSSNVSANVSRLAKGIYYLHMNIGGIETTKEFVKE